MIKWIFIFIIGLISFDARSQSTIFGPKGGFTAGVQIWDDFQRSPLFSYHGAFFIEGYKEGASTALFAQFGLHNRGSSERVFFVNGNRGTAVRQTFQFRNAAAIFGAKKRLNTDGNSQPYYSFGVRAEYTVSTNLNESSEYAGYFPIEAYTNKWNYGATFAFGYEFPFSEFVGGLIEASINPDLSYQYQQPGNIRVISPLTGQGVTLREQQIRNITFELSVGFRFLHKVIYLDD